MAEWTVGLQNVSGQRLGQVLSALRESSVEHPPNLNEFLRMCRRHPSHRVYKVPQIANPATPETQAREVSRMRAILTQGRARQAEERVARQHRGRRRG